ncbi:Hypothetical_protein [Hexamita inflata]|uniref:Hypothetical_protein n=1 Tax=Hexamita inflata TaxID=28002 RepID=A0AA86R6C0_9EUKA|nr:Hypothetical protein HINF_LOCUS50395 [Hexamita inflata]
MLQVLRIPPQNSYTNLKIAVVATIKQIPYRKQEQIWYDLSFLLNMRVVDVQKYFELEYCQSIFQKQETLCNSFSTQWDSSANNQELTQNTQIRVLKIPVGEKKNDKQLMVKHHKFSQEEIMMIRQLCLNSDLPDEAKLDIIQQQLEFRNQISQFSRLLQQNK